MELKNTIDSEKYIKPGAQSGQVDLQNQKGDIFKDIEMFMGSNTKEKDKLEPINEVYGGSVDQSTVNVD